jgi:uncharacterized membrane protein
MRTDDRTSDKAPHWGAFVSAGMLVGVGLGGFVDGIVLHQILQWHNMLSSRVPPDDLVAMKYNMVWDGLFHAAAWIVTTVGIIWLFRLGGRADVPWNGRAFAGSLLLGWGAFNLVEGLLDHQILGLHHVHPGAGQAAWDFGFLLFSAALVAIGWTLVRATRYLRLFRERPLP